MDSGSDDSFTLVLCCVSAAFAALTIATLFLRQSSEYSVPARDIRKGHRWYNPTLTDPVYCNVCELLVQVASRCDSCGIYADRSCIQAANVHLQCKVLAWAGKEFKHHWIKGNFAEHSVCCVCCAEVGTDGLVDERCCWCQRIIHSECKSDLDLQTCDFGPFGDFTVPPTSIRLRSVGWQGRRHLTVGEVQPLIDDPTWQPLVVIGNRKSGNNDGEEILRKFREYLNPAQVIDLDSLPVESALEWCHLITDRPCRILVAGGDGSIGWVLNTVDKLNFKHTPLVAVLPLGTGNDLSRVLGWGEGHSGNLDMEILLNNIRKASVTKLDRWKIEVQYSGQLGGLLHSSKVFYMNNYYSIGVDALITLNFHKTRQSKFYPFGSRVLNKVLFVGYATKDALEHACKNLHNRVSLWLDDTAIELPPLEAVIFLNIPSYGAGCDPWALGEGGGSWPPQRINDKKLEVLGIYSSFHIGQMQMGLSEPVRLGQANNIRMVMKESVPMQIDGEPWEQSACEVRITHHSQASMLSTPL